MGLWGRTNPVIMFKSTLREEGPETFGEYEKYFQPLAMVALKDFKRNVTDTQL